MKNKDILQELLTTKGTRRINWIHVKAHTGKHDWNSIWNDRVDKMAKAAANMQP